MRLNPLVHFSDASLIAVHVLVALAHAPDQLVQTHDLADGIGASEHNVAKVLQRLGRVGLVRSQKGPSGGFALGRAPESIGFREAIEAIDGPIAEDFCPYRSDHCHPEECIFGDEIRAHSRDLLAYLDSRTIADATATRG